MNSIKQVYPTHEVPHLWAHKAQASARNPQGNLFFDGDIIFSYGRHYPIAKRIIHKGKKAILFNAQRSSVTTERHKRQVRRAIPSSTVVLYAYGINDKPIDIYKKQVDLYRQACQLVAREPRAPSIAKLIREAETPKIRAKQFADFFGYKFKEINLDTDGIKILKEDIDRARRRYEALYHKAKREADREYAEAERQLPARIEEWRAGGSYWDLTLGIRHNTVPILLRISKDGTNVETSLGAFFPIEHAKLAVRLLPAITSEGGYVKSTAGGKTIRLGHYTVDEVTPDGHIRAGCHFVKADEVKHFIQLLNSYSENQPKENQNEK